MNILWIAPYPYNDGKSIYHPAPWISMLSSRLSNESDIKLSILTTSSKISSEIETNYSNGINFIYLKHKNSLFTNELQLFKPRIKKVRKYVEKHQDEYDVLHLHGSEHQYHSSVKKINIPKVLSTQGILYEYAKVVPNKLTIKYITFKLGGIYEENDLKYVENFSCRTHWDSNYVRKVNQNARIFNIWEMIRPSFFEDHFSSEKKKILFIGGTQMIKGYKQMLTAFNQVKSKINIKLVLAGGTDIEEIKKYISQNNLKNIKNGDIEFRGFLNEQGIIDVYDECFCFVHPTYIDNSPNSVCEAQLAGLPTIASNVGGVSTLIKHKETGLLTDLNPKSISDNILELYENDNLRRNISERSREISRKRHNPNTILKDNLEMYRTIANK